VRISEVTEVPLKIERNAMGPGNRRSDGLRGEYLLPSIRNPLEAKTPPIALIGLGALLVLGARLIVMLG
jgi:hypothetical protein